MADTNNFKAPRIAIKLGNKATQNPASNISPTNPAPVLGKRPRRVGLGGSDSDNSDDEEQCRHEAITGFDINGAEDKPDTSSSKNGHAPLIITPQPTRDWRAEINARRSVNRPNIATNVNKETDLPDSEKKITWGLNLLEKKPDTKESTIKDPTQPSDHKDEAPKSIEDQALDRLLGKTEKEEVKRVIKISEAEALKRDINSAADTPNLKDYDDMPVEEFGAALLRGMGWNGEDTRPKPKTVARRPNLLGLGAKELNEEENLGGWNHGNRKRPRLAEYNERASRHDKNVPRNSYKEERQREKERESGYSKHHHHNREREKDRQREADRDRYFRDSESRRGHDRNRNRERDEGHSQNKYRDRDSKHNRDGNGGKDRGSRSSRR
ncbi:Pre-mRNA-splicing factor SPP2 [Ceratocystis lukuohia]|uniref:Pre-mRNA-splicing factor n=1 Tax=Ceratocystis lukuohia TaxID=2019550 RepID=A0ABR4MEA8_9PEZI